MNSNTDVVKKSESSSDNNRSLDTASKLPSAEHSNVSKSSTTSRSKSGESQYRYKGKSVGE